MLQNKTVTFNILFTGIPFGIRKAPGDLSRLWYFNSDPYAFCGKYLIYRQISHVVNQGSPNPRLLFTTGPWPVQNRAVQVAGWHIWAHTCNSTWWVVAQSACAGPPLNCKGWGTIFVDPSTSWYWNAKCALIPEKLLESPGCRFLVAPKAQRTRTILFNRSKLFLYCWSSINKNLAKLIIFPWKTADKSFNSLFLISSPRATPCWNAFLSPLFPLLVNPPHSLRESSFLNKA